ncbi:hypothetical protein T484DRAFT_1757440 [Baffinella frigidus]|nr:hypothetical protein T484DRAFT_1757440 [Cryptophyta sp. CCMP2293]
MSDRRFELRLPRPQRGVLTTIRIRLLYSVTQDAGRLFHDNQPGRSTYICEVAARSSPLQPLPGRTVCKSVEISGASMVACCTPLCLAMLSMTESQLCGRPLRIAYFPTTNHPSTNSILSSANTPVNLTTEGTRADRVCMLPATRGLPLLGIVVRTSSALPAFSRNQNVSCSVEQAQVALLVA